MGFINKEDLGLTDLSFSPQSRIEGNEGFPILLVDMRSRFLGRLSIKPNRYR
jgi:hypothetical protein